MFAALGDGEGALVSGGGSMAACEVGGLVGIAGSGKAGMSSSPLVSMVISLVSVCCERRVYCMGEHLTAIDAFLCPGRWATGGLLRPARVYM